MNHITRRSCFAVLFTLFIAISAHADPSATPPLPDRVILITMDGLRPDLITPDLMPTLHTLGQQGTRFARHHPVYPSSTEVNGSVLSTGRYPQNNGIIANREFRPDVNPKEAVPTHVLKLLTPTIAQILAAHGQPSLISGTKPVVKLANPLDTRAPGDTSVVIYAGEAKTPDPATSKSWPPFPPKAVAAKAANTQQDAWTTARIVDRINDGTLPRFTHLWLSEPDFAQHGAGILSAPGKDALKSSDTCLQNVVDALKKKGLWESTALLIVSDHGFSTITRFEDVSGSIEDNAKLSTVRDFKEPAKPGDILVVGNGGTVTFYVVDHKKEDIQKLVSHLQTTDYAGVLFTREGIPGTFPLTQAFIGSKDAPDVVMSLKWTAQTPANGVPGTVICDIASALKIGSGMHVTLSPYDLHNTLIAIGAGIRPGLVSQTPSGNIDVAPTILTLLGLPDEAAKMDGRVLVEALTQSKEKPPEPQTQVHRATAGQWTQILTITTCGKSTYIDEGSSTLVKPN